MERNLFPTRIIDFGGSIKNVDTLLKEKPLLSGFFQNDVMLVEGNSYVILDFGKEICASLRIISSFGSKERNTKIRLRFGESVSETLSDAINYRDIKEGDDLSAEATNDHALRDYVINIPFMSDTTFPQTGFRFVRIDFIENCNVRIQSIVAKSSCIEKEQVYDYNGGDKLIKEIFDTAKRTVDLCVQNGYVWDGIKRDRLVWMGDMHPEMLALTTLYGKVDEMENSIKYHADITPEGEWVNNMPMYSLWYLILVCDYYEVCKSKEFVSYNLPVFKRILSQCSACVGENGELNYPEYFLDWPTRAFDERIEGCRSLNVYCFKKVVAFLKEIGEDSTVAENLLNRLLKVEPKEILNFKQIIAFKYFAYGKITEKEKSALIEGGAKGLSTFMSYYILKAIAETSGKEIAIDIMKEYYGSMLSLGATSFFEDYDISWAKNASRIDELPTPDKIDFHRTYGQFCYKYLRHSLCHGWSSGVVKFIHEYCF